MRAFIAIALPSDVAKTLAEQSMPLKEKLEVRVPLLAAPSSQVSNILWVPPENYHLTLFFLGNVSEEVLQQIDPLIREKLEGLRAFSVELSQIAFFPHSKKPHVIAAWTKPQRELLALQQTLLGLLASFVSSDLDLSKPFLPHITLARLKKGFRGTISPISLELIFRADEIQIFESKTLPSGSIYLERSRIKFH